MKSFDDYLIDDDLEENISFVDGPLSEKSVGDSGKKGKNFEKTMIKALEAAGLKMETNAYAGSLWDIKPTGKGWTGHMSGKPVNIKQSRTKWTWASSELYKMLPWDGFEGEFDTEKAAVKVKKWIKKKGLQHVIYFKAKTPEVQDEIRNIADDISIKNMEEKEEAAKKLFSSKNFYAEKLESGWSVRVLTRDGRVSSIAIDSGGKVFMRSEKPRKLGGSTMVTFRTPTAIPGKGKARSIMK